MQKVLILVMLADGLKKRSLLMQNPGSNCLSAFIQIYPSISRYEPVLC